jgi:hypothetical protein
LRSVIYTESTTTWVFYFFKQTLQMASGREKIRIIKFFLSTPWIENTTENLFLILKIMKEALINFWYQNVSNL